RTRRLRVRRDPHRRPDRALLGCRSRGDLPDDRQLRVPGQADRRPLRSDHTAFPATRAAGHGAAALEVADRVRGAHPHRLLRRGSGRRPDAGVQPHRPGTGDDPADALHTADAAPLGLPL
ncbi:MAG: Acyltransferase family protein, partial [uncultured Nocardioidaceae bacterium]